MLCRNPETKFNTYTNITVGNTYLNGKLIVLQGRVYHHDEGEWNQSLLHFHFESFAEERN
jgi:hypothetical protein